MPSTITTKIALPKTGQTTSYAEHDDGYYEKGSLTSPRFVDNGDGTITDRVTNLMWMKQPELIIPGTSVRADNKIQVAKGNWNWNTAYSVGDLAFSSEFVELPEYNDTYGEIICVYAHTSMARPDWQNSHLYAVNDYAYDTVDGQLYKCNTGHTSATAPTTFAEDRAGGASGYWDAYGGAGAEGGAKADFVAHPTYWRGTPFKNNADDLTTPRTLVWTYAINKMVAVNNGFAGYTDWRLPNVEELISIENYENSNPSIDISFFPNTQYSYYWSSTTPAGYSSIAYACEFSGGLMSSSEKINNYYVRYVRSIN